jgi:SAM-dependent methyltransferase
VNRYRLLYRLGITPWERSAVPGPIRELAERYATPGRALDVGCGTGRDAVYLAGRGWSVTGVDAIPRALDGARRRASESGAQVNWVLGDVSELGTLGIGDGYGLVLDRGCFHGLADEERRGCARGITAAAAADATFLLLAFHPRDRGLGPRGVTREQIQAAFQPGWEIAASRPDPEARLPRWIGDAKPTWYELRRLSR